MIDGVIQVTACKRQIASDVVVSDTGNPVVHPRPNLQEFFEDQNVLLALSTHGPMWVKYCNYIIDMFCWIHHLQMQAAKKIVFTACHSGKLKLAFASPDVISTSPKSFLMRRIDFTVLLLFQFLKKHHLAVGQVRNSPGLLDTAFFACCTWSNALRLRMYFSKKIVVQ